MPSGGSRKGAAPRRPRKRAAATMATASGGFSGAARRGGGSPLDPDDRLLREAAQEGADRGVEVAAVLRLERDLHLVLGVGELRVRAEHQVRMAGQQLVQVVGQGALPHAHVDAAEMEWRVAEALLERVELLPEDLGHLGQDVDVPHHHRGEDELAVRGELGALRHLRHLEPRLVEPALVVALQHLDQPRLPDDRHVERARDALDRHVVVGRAHPAGGEHPVVGGAERPDLRRDQVHLDRKSTLPNVERLAGEITALGRQARFFNVNAADEEKRAEVASEMERVLRERDEVGQVRVLLHSLAFGTLKLFVADPIKEAVTKAQMDMTLDVMAHSLIYWAQELVGRGLMGRGGRIYAMTSAGGARVLPHHGPVSAAQAALRSNIRQLAAALAPPGITSHSLPPPR